MSEIKNVRKIKILYLLNIFKRKTDQNNGLTITQIFDELYMRGITAERKSIYSDINALRDAGYNIVKRKSDEVYYHLESEEINGEDIKNMAYIMQSSPIISKAKSNEYIIKLSKQTTSQNESKLLNGILKYYSSDKKDILNDISVVFKAIYEQRKISFDYKNEKFNISPFCIAEADGSHYIIGGSRSFLEKVDCFDFSYISDIKALDRKAGSVGEITGDNDFDMDKYIKTNLIPNTTEAIPITLNIEESEILPFMDDISEGQYIGDANIEKIRNFVFSIKISMQITPGLLSYLFINTDKAEVISPRSLKEKILRMKKLLD